MDTGTRPLSAAEKRNLPRLPIWIGNPPDYKEGQTHPFNKGKQVNLHKALKKTEGGDIEPRTIFFEKTLLGIWLALDRNPVPYVFRTADGDVRSLDAGCLGFLYNRPKRAIEFVDYFDGGYIRSVVPTLTLQQRYDGQEAKLQSEISCSPANNEVTDDIMSILANASTSATERRQLIDSRIGQGAFRRNVLARWNGRCAVTDCDLQEIIRASHIVPWSAATNDERMDPANGLPLVATLDALFDLGLISFNKDGEVLFSDKLDAKHHELVPAPRRLTHAPSSTTKTYLARHRAEHGFCN